MDRGRRISGADDEGHCSGIAEYSGAWRCGFPEHGSGGAIILEQLDEVRAGVLDFHRRHFLGFGAWCSEARLARDERLTERLFLLGALLRQGGTEIVERHTVVEAAVHEPTKTLGVGSAGRG